MRFTLPRDIYFGENSLEELKHLVGKKAIVVTGGHAMQKYGFLDKVVSYLKEAGLEVRTFEGVENDPSVQTVMKGAAAMRKFEPDWIIALGGGSPIDAAKAMWVFYEYPDATFDSILQPYSFPTLRTKARFVAIGSTSGTATEVTSFAVITDPEKGIKYPLADFNITPDIAIVDPALPMTMPKSVTAFTGMDALTHATEAYVANYLTDGAFTDPYCLMAIELIVKNIVKSYNGDKKAREQMHYAQCIAGMAFSNALLGITHSMAHKTGAAFSTGHVPHGEANAMYLPHVIEWNRKDPRALRKYATIAEHLHLAGTTDEEKCQSYIDLIKKLNEELDIPHGLKEFGVKEDEFLEKLPTIAKNAVGDACTFENPRKTEAEDFEKILKACYYNTVIDF